LKIGPIFVIAAPVPLAIGIALDTYVAAGRALESDVAASILAAVAIVVSLGFWYAYPFWCRVNTHNELC
jgi:hypothetical protein